MIWIVSMVFAVLVSGAVFFTGRALRAEADPKSPEADRGLLVMLGGVVLFAIWVGGHTAFASIRQVEAGSVVIVYQFGEIVDQRAEGLKFIAPWQDTRTESIQTQRRQFDNISGFSKETQDVFITATLNYSVAPTAVQNLYRNVGADWFDRLIPTRINQFFKAETVLFDTTDIAPNREIIRENVRQRLLADLAQFSITVEDLLIDNIDFNPAFKTSIEAKQIASQDALRELERVNQAEAEAQQVVAKATGDAEAIRVLAAGQADANDLLAASLTDRVIQFQALEKLADNIQIALIPSGENIIIDPAALLGTVGSSPAPTAVPTPAPSTAGNE
jgi:prohibitin 2